MSRQTGTKGKHEVTPMMINGEKCKRIGKGQFSTAYRSIDDPNVVYLLTNEDDNIREIYRHITNKHIPQMELLEQNVYIGRKYVNVWKMPYYKPIKKSDPCWKQYKTLYDAWQEIYTPLISAYFYKKQYSDGFMAAEQFLQILEEKSIIDQDLLYALERINVWSSCYGSGYIFEFQKRNVGVDQDGNLVLRDVIFMNSLAAC